jgi:antitoxin PrlF
MAKGQITIPRDIREHLGLSPNTEVEWKIQAGEAVLRKASKTQQKPCRELVQHMRGRGTVQMSTDEIMAMMR